jgi:hypothetical protein
VTAADLRSVPPGLGRGRRIALAVGAAGATACGAGALVDPQQFFRSYLWAYAYWTGIPLGCLGLLMLQHLTGGAWGLSLRRLLESGSRTLPLLALLFLPILAGLPSLYPWARPEAVAADEVLRHKAAYLNVPFFVLRAAIYFGLWIALAELLGRWSGRQDEDRSPGLSRRLQATSGVGLGLYVLTVTFASVDWLMSLEPHWYSTIYGGLIVTGQVLSAASFATVVLILLAPHPPLSAIASPGRFHDLGKLLLTFVMVWAYFAFSQFLIIWAGNLPEEIPHYLRRLSGGWQWLGLALVALQFALPFLLLLSRGRKRDPRRLRRIAVLVLGMGLANTYLLAAPAFSETVAFHWLDAAAVAGIGGLWVGFFLWQLGCRPLLPLGDPYLKEALGDART